jgi:phage terminase large subunit-like protein
MTGEPLKPWQRWAAIHALETVPGGDFRFRVVIILVARQNGKSHLKRTITLWRMFIDDARLVLGVAQDVSLAREQWQMAIDTINGTPDLRPELEQVRRVNGDEQFRLTSGSRYKIAASNRSAGRGLSIDELNIDELREQRNWDAWSALSKTTMARRNSQIWAMSNAGDDESVVLNQLRDAALSGRDPSIGLFEWSAEDGCELDDPKAWQQANPALGQGVSEAAIRSAMATDPPNVFRTEVLCQRVDQLDGAIDLAAWKACADPAGTMEGLRERVILCFDVAPDGQHATLSAAAQLDDGRARTEIVRAWKTTDAARAELPELLERIKPQAVAWYPTGPAAAFAPMFRPDPRMHSRIQYVELTGMKVAEACQGLADLAVARKVVHNADPLLDSHVSAAQKMPAGDGWRFTRKGEGHVDAVYAAAGAVYVALVTPVVQRARIRMLG